MTGRGWPHSTKSRAFSDRGKICAGRSGVTLFRGRSHPDTFGQCLEDERVAAPDHLGELFVGVADRFDREIGEIEDGCRPALWNRSGKSPTTIRSTSLPSWKSPRENDPWRMTAETCRRARISRARSRTCSITRRASASRHCRSSPRARCIPRHPPCHGTPMASNSPRCLSGSRASSPHGKRARRPLPIRAVETCIVLFSRWRGRAGAARPRSQLTVCTATMADVEDDNLLLRMVYGVYDPIVPHADPVEMFCST